MEACRFGFQTAPAFKFDPTDADLVAHYLLPRALGVPDPPFAHAIIDDDPAGLPPVDLFARHGHGGSHHAFFLHTADADAPESRERVVKGGAGGRWRGQRASVETVTLVHPGGGGELDIQYRRSELAYERGAGKGEDAGAAAADATGWVMHEYQIVSPPLQATVLSRISKVRENQQPSAAAAAQS